MMNNSFNECIATQNIVANVMPPVLIIEFLLGLPTNMVALWIFCRRLHAWRPNTVYLMNLMLADFLLLASLPFRIDTLRRGENWVFGDAMCRMNLFMLAVNRSASVAFMTMVAVDRYFKVVHPHHRVNRLMARHTVAVSGAAWAVVVCLRLPLVTEKLLRPDKGTGNLMCRSFGGYEHPPPGIRLHYAVFVGEVLLPLLLLIFCSVRIICILQLRQLDRKQKVRRAIHVILLIVGVFTVCFLPSVATGLSAIFIKKFRPHDCPSYLLAGQLFSLSIGFTYLNSALDPVIYCFSSSLFRNALKESINGLGGFNMQVSRRGSVTSDG
ncbi:hydroxycarboxylic acid receptor 2 [Megalops cyprinoides]|uniref:hydroxycarboxylic acid receptor 2 n=1 Tax=Megalops cyprinoides TaxID=118141 RepID=UPI001863DE18|nr:hydroxycarboxylic acid receptor 2 [Megalops cyprinoides]XP_036403220.1 hydroxycarboxylic acid receptor 2 [Megalops cyprinoides]